MIEKPSYSRKRSQENKKHKTKNMKYIFLILILATVGRNSISAQTKQPPKEWGIRFKTDQKFYILHIEKTYVLFDVRQRGERSIYRRRGTIDQSQKILFFYDKNFDTKKTTTKRFLHFLVHDYEKKAEFYNEEDVREEILFYIETNCLETPWQKELFVNL